MSMAELLRSFRILYIWNYHCGRWITTTSTMRVCYSKDISFYDDLTAGRSTITLRKTPASRFDLGMRGYFHRGSPQASRTPLRITLLIGRIAWGYSRPTTKVHSPLITPFWVVGRSTSQPSRCESQGRPCRYASYWGKSIALAL